MPTYEYRPGGFVESVMSDMKFEEHLRRLAESRRLRMEGRRDGSKPQPRPEF